MFRFTDLAARLVQSLLTAARTSYSLIHMICSKFGSMVISHVRKDIIILCLYIVETNKLQPVTLRRQTELYHLVLYMQRVWSFVSENQSSECYKDLLRHESAPNFVLINFRTFLL